MSDIELSGDGIGENKMNTCKNCGEPLGADSNYCPNCGTKVPAGDTAQKKLEEMSREELLELLAAKMKADGDTSFTAPKSTNERIDEKEYAEENATSETHEIITAHLNGKTYSISELLQKAHEWVGKNMTPENVIGFTQKAITNEDGTRDALESFVDKLYSIK